ncbi:MAG: hypothetical protein AB8B64_12795 [Granulosicoccus sp.]
MIEPFGMTALMQELFKATEDQRPNLEWEQKLDPASSRFEGLKEKARRWAGAERNGPARSSEDSVPL